VLGNLLGNTMGNCQSANAVAADPPATSAEPAPMPYNQLMISYSHRNMDFMRQIRTKLQAKGFTVWVDESELNSGSAFFSRIGEAILKCQAVIFLMSVDSVTSRYCQDEISLAYISNKPIFPCCMGSFEELDNAVDSGMKLAIATLQWTMFDSADQNAFQESSDKLATALKDVVKPEQTAPLPAKTGASKPALVRLNSVHADKLLTSIKTEATSATGASSEEDSFWSRNFQGQQSVEKEAFNQCFEQEYGKEIEQLLDHDPIRGMEWFSTLMQRQVFDDKDPSLAAFTAFRGSSPTSIRSDVDTGVQAHQHLFYLKVRDCAVEEFCLQEVVAIEKGGLSLTDRVAALQQLADNDSAVRVVKSIRSIMSDETTLADCRVLGTMALGQLRFHNNSEFKLRFEAVMLSAGDTDRLVRAAAGVSLGNLAIQFEVDGQNKAAADHYQQAVIERLARLWRNDPISTVRDNARAVLNSLGEMETFAIADAIDQALVKDRMQMLKKAKSSKKGQYAQGRM
jgi:hypothetical protein